MASSWWPEQPFPQLTSKNYYEWSIQMKKFLIDQKMWDVIENGVETILAAAVTVKAQREARARDKRALSVLQCNIYDANFDRIAEIKNAKSAWETLQKAHRSVDEKEKKKEKEFEKIIGCYTKVIELDDEDDESLFGFDVDASEIDFELDYFDLPEEVRDEENSGDEETAAVLHKSLEHMKKELKEKIEEIPDCLAKLKELEARVKEFEDEIEKQGEAVEAELPAVISAKSYQEFEMRKLEDELKKCSEKFSENMSTIMQFQTHSEDLEEELEKQTKELEIHVASLEEKLDNQVLEFESYLEAVTRAKVVQEQLAIRTEETLRLVCFEKKNKVVEPVALQAMEFRSCICDVEIDILKGDGDELCFLDGWGEFVKACSLKENDLVISKYSDSQQKRDKWIVVQDQDEGTWNLVMAGGTCLSLVTRTVGDDMVPLVKFFIQENIQQPDWRKKEVVDAYNKKKPEVDLFKGKTLKIPSDDSAKCLDTGEAQEHNVHEYEISCVGMVDCEVTSDNDDANQITEIHSEKSCPVDNGISNPHATEVGSDTGLETLDSRQVVVEVYGDARSVKSLKHKMTGMIRLIVRQSKTLEIYVNCHVIPATTGQGHTENEKSYVWDATDFADGELKNELLCIRFATVKNCKTFTERFQDGAASQNAHEEEEEAEAKQKESEVSHARDVEEVLFWKLVRNSRDPLAELKLLFLVEGLQKAEEKSKYFVTEVLHLNVIVEVVAAINSRWPTRRLEYAAEVIVDALKTNYDVKLRGMPRQDVRDAAGLHIDNTGLLDYVLKSISNVTVGNYVVWCSINPANGVLEYSICEVSGDGEAGCKAETEVVKDIPMAVNEEPVVELMRGGNKVVVEPHRHEDVIFDRGKEDALVTKNLVLDDAMYNEKRISVQNEDGTKVEYRIWNSFHSKLASAVLGGVDHIWIKSGAKMLYLGGVSGITVSRVSNIVEPDGVFYAVEFSHGSGRDLINMAKIRITLICTIEDVRKFVLDLGWNVLKGAGAVLIPGEFGDKGDEVKIQRAESRNRMKQVISDFVCLQ